MPVVRIPTAEITDWQSFHAAFERVLGFPDFYGRNMSAWVDCLTSADALDDGMVGANVVAAEGDVLTLALEDAASFASRCPEQYRGGDRVLGFCELATARGWRAADPGSLVQQVIPAIHRLRECSGMTPEDATLERCGEAA